MILNYNIFLKNEFLPKDHKMNHWPQQLKNSLLEWLCFNVDDCFTWHSLCLTNKFCSIKCREFSSLKKTEFSQKMYVLNYSFTSFITNLKLGTLMMDMKKKQHIIYLELARLMDFSLQLMIKKLIKQSEKIGIKMVFIWEDGLLISKMIKLK